MTAYSLRTVGKAIGLDHATVLDRARKLGMNTSNGITAAQAKAIAEYKKKTPHGKGSVKELIEEMRNIK